MQRKKGEAPSKPRRRSNGDGSILWRPDRERYQLSIVIGSKRYYRYAKTEKEAREIKKQLLKEHEQGLNLDRPKYTVKQFIDHWLKIKRSSIRKTTYISYVCNTNRLVPLLGQYKLDKLQPDHIQAAYSAMHELDYEPNTIHSTHNIFACVLKDALKWGYLAVNPLDRVETPKRHRKEMRALTLDEASQLMKATEGHWLSTLIVLALATGMRRGELMGLRWKDINFDAKTVTVKRTVVYLSIDGETRYEEEEPKTATGRRTITLPDFALAALKAHRVEQLQGRMRAGSSWQERDLVFTNEHGSYYYPKKLLDDFHEITDQAGIGYLRFHDLRHSAATILLSMGVPVKVVQEILGHSSADITLSVYAHASQGMHTAAMADYNAHLLETQTKQLRA